MTLLALVVRALDALEDGEYDLVLACLQELELMLADTSGALACR
jgi:hypothetical protein